MSLQRLSMKSMMSRMGDCVPRISNLVERRIARTSPSSKDISHLQIPRLPGLSWSLSAAEFIRDIFLEK